MPLLLQKLNLTHFRSYDALRLDFAAARMAVFTGPNGAGKTNILEAISLLIPGRGLRGADLLEMKSRTAGPEDLWAVSAEVETASGEQLRIGTGLDRDYKRRVVRIGGKDAKAQNELTAHVSCVWLTPQMDRLFLEGASARRKFFDRLVYAFEPAHVTRLNHYDATLRERMKILVEHRHSDPRWLDALETQLAADAVSIAASRLNLLSRLAHYVAQLGEGRSVFPLPYISLSGWTETEIQQRPALAVEDALKERFRQSRGLDAHSGKSHEGIHRSDFLVRYGVKDMPADQCSTGEQKGLLTAIVLAHALMMQGEKGFVPLLLLDEVAAHLDDARRDELFAILSALNGQVFLTGTDPGIFSALKNMARFFAVEGAGATPRAMLDVVAK
ncbi:MAG TPA: DNA replication/repair protein RecF [Patescibacteria group bacterium]|nr:DNA replication/repair protein RecF [Patescibacteria group bacterium]